MTLSTDVYVLDPVEPDEVFDFCRSLLGATAMHSWQDQEGWREDGARVLSNDPGQNLPAWLMLHYRPGAPLRTAEQAAEHEDYCATDCGGEDHRIACYLNVDFDTSYSYRDEKGRGCGDLHADLVSKLGQWLDAKGIRWKWCNEFTGEIHDGYEQLSELGSGGHEAESWMRTSVLPAILSGLLDDNT